MTQRINSMAPARQSVALVACACVVLTCGQTGCATTQQPRAQAELTSQSVQTAPAAPAQPSTQDLDQLVAPIALYPDQLVAQILSAATNPTQIVEADRWIQQNTSLKGDALGKAVDQQSWDSSVKSLATFPTVLEMMDKNLSWTSSLGEAYDNNQAAVMDAVQKMRQKAQQAGNLKSTSQESVTTQNQTIVIEPTAPDVVYVPEYDPWLVYGAPLGFYPGWVGFPGLFVGGPGMFFGAGFGIGAFASFGWGWHNWGADWHNHWVNFNHHPFPPHGPTFGQHPGAFGHPGGFAHAGGQPGGFHPGGANPGGFHPTGLNPGGVDHPGSSPSAMHSSAFSGFNHGGVANAYSARGSMSARISASHGGFAGGGFHGGGFHGGGGHR
jgi:hypothetical protein